jgi:hypothetical protein
MSTTTVLTSPHIPGDGFFTVANLAAALAANGGTPANATVHHAPSPTWPVDVSGTYSVAGANSTQLTGCFLLDGTDAPFQVSDTVTLEGLAPQQGAGGSGPTTLLFSCLACTPVENTSTSTSVFGSPTNANGSLTIPVAAGNVLRWALTGSYSCVAGSTISASVLLGGSPILVSSSPPTLAAAATNQLATSRFNLLSILSAGADATAAGVGDLLLVQTASNQVGSSMIPGGTSPASFAGFDGANPVLFDIRIQFSAASPDSSFAITSFKLFLE